MPLIKRADRLAWLTVALLAAACCILAVLQYRWISEFSEAERTRLAADLRSRLSLVAAGFNQQVSIALSNLDPSRTRLFRRVALVTREENGLTFSALDPRTGRFSPAAWPDSWESIKQRFEARADYRPPSPLPADLPPIVESHFFGEDRWLIAEINSMSFVPRFFPISSIAICDRPAISITIGISSPATSPTQPTLPSIFWTISARRIAILVCRAA